jgi:hypothetical protein
MKDGRVETVDVGELLGHQESLMGPKCRVSARSDWGNLVERTPFRQLHQHHRVRDPLNVLVLASPVRLAQEVGRDPGSVLYLSG